MAVMRNAAQAVEQPKLRVQQHDSAQLNGLGQWWNSRAPMSPPNGSCCWAACCAAAPGVAVTWALPGLCCTPLPGLCCTLTSAAEAIGASAIAAAEAAMASGAKWLSFSCATGWLVSDQCKETARPCATPCSAARRASPTFKVLGKDRDSTSNGDGDGGGGLNTEAGDDREL